LFLNRYLGEVYSVILEIGALDNPTFLKDEGDVYFADFFTQQESITRHIGNSAHTVDRIVDVDFILREKNIREAITIRPDITIANHVIEHIPNPIQWLQDIRSFSAVGAGLFLSAPDRRFTFDYFKPVTDAVDWLRAYDERLSKPSYYQILRHLYYHADLRQEAAWAGRVPSTHLHRLAMSAAMDQASTLALDYTDVHCSIFTFDSFQTLISDLEDTDLIPWRIEYIEDVKEGENEFRVLLKAI
jgi:hypothetical protein